MEKKFIFVGIVIRNGIYTYNSSMVYEIPKEQNTLEFARQRVKSYHSDTPFQKNEKYDWWYFFCGEISAMLETAEEITEQEYKILRKFQYK